MKTSIYEEADKNKIFEKMREADGTGLASSITVLITIILMMLFFIFLHI